MIQFLIFVLPILDLAWYVWARWRLAKLGNLRPLRWGVTAFFVIMLMHYAWILFHRRTGIGPGTPAYTLGLAYVWHLLVLLPLFVLILFGETLRAAYKSLMLILCKPSETELPLSEKPEAVLSRRDFLTMAAVAAPPVLTIITGTAGYVQTHHFKITRMDIDVPGLPPELDGATIAHLSDTHTGRFTDAKMLKRIVTATNDLRADVIVMTGDLIDYSLEDLPASLDAMRHLDSPNGVYLCEGNHDLFESREEFERQVRASGLDILINQTRDIQLRGRQVQLHGLRWGAENGDPHIYRHDGGAQPNLEIIQPLINPDAFSILLAHHPHAFDAASDLGIPLTLSGHTHGGQLMLSDTIGAGPLMFKYWSGLYRRGPSRLVVSNGVGNWLPVRTHAPAEVALLTLRSTALA